ncbi:hypothetical protein V3W47_15770 [Deinococcus sp. YIM 134068]|uniref:hypothetical protein n=1 Tax=Deinococcus lichenicola TaxID=3118910 RepID=UPI002F942173
MRRRLLPVLLLPLLSSCDYYSRDLPEPTPVSFKDDPRILRGVWVGQLKASDADVGQTLRLDLKATYLSSFEYAVSGSAAIGTQTFSVEGTVSGGAEHSYLRPQTSPVPSGAHLNLRGDDGTTANTMFCDVLSENVTDPLWRCFASATSQSFDLKRENP